MKQPLFCYIQLALISIASIAIDYFAHQYISIPIFVTIPLLLATRRFGLKIGMSLVVILLAIHFILIRTQPITQDSSYLIITNFIACLSMLGVISFLSSCNIKTREWANQVLESAQLQISTLTKGSDDVFVIFDTNGIITAWGSGAEENFGYTSREMVGSHIGLLIPEFANKSFSKIKKISQHCDRQCIEIEIINKIGERIPVRILWTPIPNSRGEISGYVATIRDNSEQKIIEGVIYEGQARFKLALENAGHGYWDWDIENNSLYLDERCKKIFGLPPEQIDFSCQHFKEIIHPEDYELVQKKLQNHEKLNESGFDHDYRIKRSDGTWAWVNSRGRVIERDQNNNPLRVIGTIHDITERKEATEKLRLQEERFRKAFDYAPIGLALVSPEGAWLRVNKRICEIVGYTEEELLKIDFQTITHPEDLETDLNYVKQMLEGTIQTYQMEKRYFHKKGHIVHVLLAVSLVRDNQNQPLYFISQIKDITARKMAEEKLKQSLREKETLLQEIHHRVKNNLAVIGSLFYLQSRYTDDPTILRLLQDCQDRVRSMALVHEQLYNSPDLSKINFSQYTRELVQSLHRNYNHSGHDIQLQLDLESVTLDVEKAIPCGLILNELITNAFKHAFPNQSSGHIRVSLTQKETGEVTLSVMDSGIGIKPDIIENKKLSLGMRLIHSLSKQIDGRVDFINHNPGTEVTLTMGA